MDKRFQDIHYKNEKSTDNEIVIREVNIMIICFEENTIHIRYRDCFNTKTLVLPKLKGYQLIID